MASMTPVMTNAPMASFLQDQTVADDDDDDVVNTDPLRLKLAVLPPFGAWLPLLVEVALLSGIPFPLFDFFLCRCRTAIPKVFAVCSRCY